MTALKGLFSVPVSSRPAVRTYRRKQQILSAAIGEEIVMMSVEKGQYYSLNAVGMRIWQLLETPRDLAEIVEALADNYDAPEDVICAEVESFLARMEREGLLELAVSNKT